MYDYCDKLENALMLKGYQIKVDKSGDKFNKKIRNAQVDGYNYTGVIGPKEMEDQTISLRIRDQ